MEFTDAFETFATLSHLYYYTSLASKKHGEIQLIISFIFSPIESRNNRLLLFTILVSKNEKDKKTRLPIWHKLCKWGISPNLLHDDSQINLSLHIYIYIYI